MRKLRNPGISLISRTVTCLWMVSFILRNILAQESTNTSAFQITGSCGFSKSPRIVGGTDASLGEFPWTGAKKTNTWTWNKTSILLRGTHYCGGTLINKHWVITAAHCVHRNTRKAFKVRVGEYKLNEESSQENVINVNKIIIHPDFILARYVNDLALMKLAEPVIWEESVQPICLPEPSNESYVGKEVTVAGWGWLEEPDKGGTRANVLQKLSINIVDNRECQKWYREAGKHVPINANQICAGYKDGGKDSCHGDSGGPVMIKERGKFHLIAVVSAGIGCARPLLPGLYTNVSSYLSWIKEQIQQ